MTANREDKSSNCPHKPVLQPSASYPNAQQRITNKGRKKDTRCLTGDDVDYYVGDVDASLILDNTGLLEYQRQLLLGCEGLKEQQQQLERDAALACELAALEKLQQQE